MKTNGLVFCLAMCFCLDSIVSGQNFENFDLSSCVDQALATEMERSAPVELAAFHSHATRNPFCFASAEMLFLDVDADTGGRITLSFDDSDTVGTEISFDSGTGLEDTGLASRLVLGRQFCEKWGVAARYFHLEDSLTDTPRLTPGTTPLPTFGTYTEVDMAKLYSIDLEAIRSFRPGKTKIDASLGTRHASLDVDSQVHAFGVITTGNFANLFLSNGCAFDGTGMTSGLTIRRQIGDSPVSFFLGARGSKMWGHSDSFGRAAGAVAASPSAPLVGAATVTRNNAESDLVVWETQAGLQFEMALRNYPAKAFLRLAFEYQNWDINGPPTGGAGFSGTIETLTTSSFSSASLGDTDLMGGSVATGFTW
jgi:hypothetical protein